MVAPDSSHSPTAPRWCRLEMQISPQNEFKFRYWMAPILSRRATGHLAQSFTNTMMSPLAPEQIAELASIDGVRLATSSTGMRYKNRPDLALLEFCEGTTAAGSFTRSQTAGAPVRWCREALRLGEIRGIIVNAGNANVFTGEAGEDAVRIEARSVAQALSADKRSIFVCSTGVIGEPLDVKVITDKVPELVSSLRGDGWRSAADAIRTTDTYAKLASTAVDIGGGQVRINGIAKGSGMIAPNMATTLAFLATDARVDQETLQTVLADCVDTTFNCITVDGDTSTSDSIIMGATGRGPTVSEPADIAAFKEAVHTVLDSLALQVVSDGEGLERLIEITVAGADSRQAARALASSVSNSLLLKTAIAGGDANWGRVVMALGNAAVPLTQAKLKIWFGDLLVAERGQRAVSHNESAVSEYISGRKISIRIEVGTGPGFATFRTCDLTSKFVDLNANYRS